MLATSGVWGQVIICILVVVSLLLIPAKGTEDVKNWQEIFDNVLRFGPEFIPDCLNYLCPSQALLVFFPQGHALVFYLFSLLFPVAQVGTHLSTKVLIFLFYGVTIASVVHFARMNGKKSLSIPRVVIVALSVVSLTLNAQGLGYTDVLTFPFFVLSVSFLFKKRHLLSGMFFSISCLIKWQPIIVLPVIVVSMLLSVRQYKSIAPLLRYGLGIMILPLLLSLINPHTWFGLWFSLTNSLSHTMTHALNLAWIVQYMPLGVTLLDAHGHPVDAFARVLFVVFAGAYISIIFAMTRHQKIEETQVLYAMVLGYSAYYLFSFGVHENHFILASIIALLLYFKDPSRQNRYILLCVDGVNFINMFFFYGIVGSPIVPRYLWGIDLSIMIAFLITVGMTWYIWKWLRVVTKSGLVTREK